MLLIVHARRNLRCAFVHKNYDVNKRSQFYPSSLGANILATHSRRRVTRGLAQRARPDVSVMTADDAHRSRLLRTKVTVAILVLLYSNCNPPNSPVSHSAYRPMHHIISCDMKEATACFYCYMMQWLTFFLGSNFNGYHSSTRSADLLTSKKLEYCIAVGLG